MRTGTYSISNRKPHNNLNGYVCERKSKHPKLPGHIGIFDRDKGGAWITGEDGERWGVAHLKPEHQVGGIVTVSSLEAARALMEHMADGGNSADLGQHD